MNTTKLPRARRSWAALGTALATALVAAIVPLSASAAAGPPKSVVRPSISGSAIVGNTLTAHNGAWNGTQPFMFSYQWTRCSSTGTGCVNIPDAAQSQTYILTSDDAGHRLRVIVTAQNSAGTSSRNAALTAIVKMPSANAPVNTTRPSISGSAVENNTLTVGNGAWNGLTATFTYQWQRCDANGANCAKILGATSQTYSPTSLDVGQTLRAIVVASNSAGRASSISHQSATIRSASSVQVSLNASATIVVYGHSATLSGTVAGSSGDVVTIMARPITGRTLQSIGTTTTDANGSFSTAVTPRLKTVYVAKALGAQSGSVTINVRPLLSLRHSVRGSLAVRLTAAKSFVGRYVTVQALVRGRWVAVKRVFLSHRSLGLSPTMFSTASFHLSIHHGLRVRAYLTFSQAGSMYTSATSNTVRS